MTKRLGSLLLPVSTLLIVLCTSLLASADPDDQAMRDASALYEEGRAAHAKGAHLQAAKAFAAADALVPDAAALEAALVAVVKTDDAPLGMELSARATRESGNKKIEHLAAKARERFRDQAGRIVVSCDTCEVSIDDAVVERGVATWVRIGKHRVVLRDGGAEETRKVIVEPGAVVTLVPLSPGAAPEPSPDPAPEPKPKKKPKRDRRAEPGPSSSWFWIGFAATAAVGVGAVISGVDTAAKHAEFSDEPTDERAVEGESAEIRTNVLLGVTGGLAALTLAVGLFVVDWDQDDVSLGPGGLTVRF